MKRPICQNVFDDIQIRDKRLLDIHHLGNNKYDCTVATTIEITTTIEIIISIVVENEFQT